MPREKATRQLPIAPVDRLIRKANAERVSEDAAEALAEILEELALEIAQRARELAEFAGRKTVTEKDIRLAYKQWRKS
ncbi:MAG: histone family protein [Candidatus Asgardarchaeia archaeon]